MNSAIRRGHLYVLFCIGLNLIYYSGLNGQNVSKVTKREVERRQAALPRGVEALPRAQAAMQARSYAVAHDEFRNALNLLPDAVTSARSHDEALAGFCESGVKVAEQNIADGNFAQAESVVREVLEERYDPNYRPALELLAHLQQPGYFNKTMAPKFIEKVEEVKKLLADADGYYNSGRYDLAFKKYEQVLAIDPYNTAARHGEEKIDNTKYSYNQEAYNETRARAVWQVEKGWEQPVKKYGKTVEPMTEAFQRDVTGTARITQKLNTIIIPRVEFRDASVREAIDFLRQQAADNDPTGDGKKGVDIVLRLAPLGQIAPHDHNCNARGSQIFLGPREYQSKAIYVDSPRGNIGRHVRDDRGGGFGNGGILRALDRVVGAHVHVGSVGRKVHFILSRHANKFF